MNEFNAFNRSSQCLGVPPLVALSQVEVMGEEIKDKWRYVVRNSSQLVDDEPSVVVNRIWSQPNRTEQNYDEHLPNQTHDSHSDVIDY